MTRRAARRRILVLGGGYVGLHAALTIRRKAGRRAAITLVDQRSYMTYQPFLPEAAAGSIEPRHVVVPLRATLKGCRVVQGRVTGLAHDERRATVATDYGEVLELDYDDVIVAFGSIARTLPVPGLAEFGMGFKHVEEAIALRNHVLGRLARAATAEDDAQRRRLLTFLFVGGGFAGVEAFAETEDMARAALRDYPEIRPSDLNFILVDAADRILPEMGASMGDYAIRQLRRRGMTVLLNTTLESCIDGHIVLSEGDPFDAATVVWTAGVKPNPAVALTGLPQGPRGHVIALPTLQVATAEGVVVEGAWAAGDCALVPDLTQPGRFCSPSAQHAVRQARHLGRNLARSLRARPLRPYRHRHLGMVASLGLHRGIATALGLKLRGWPAWFMHRTYHVLQVPSFNRKFRIVLDWTTALFFRRDLVSMGSLHDPGRAFREAAAD